MVVLKPSVRRDNCQNSPVSRLMSMCPLLTKEGSSRSIDLLAWLHVNGVTGIKGSSWPAFVGDGQRRWESGDRLGWTIGA